MYALYNSRWHIDRLALTSLLDLSITCMPMDLANDFVVMSQSIFVEVVDLKIT